MSIRVAARSTSWLAIGMFAVTCALAPRAYAQDAGTAQRVEELKRRGNQAMLDLRYTEALAAYKEAIALTPDDAALYFNVGRAEQAREAYPEALDAFQEFDKRATPEVRARVPKLDELIADVRSRVAVVTIACTAAVDDALITLGDRARVTGCGPTPKEVRASVPSRTLAVEAQLESSGYRADPVKVTLEGGKPPVAVAFTTLPKTTTGSLVIRAVPATAVISVDKTARGNSPVEVILPAGPHDVDVSAAEHQPQHLALVVEAGGRREVSVSLEREAAITSKWWFWTGVGVAAVAVGTVVTILIVQPEKSPGSGTIQPGLVRF